MATLWISKEFHQDGVQGGQPVVRQNENNEAGDSESHLPHRLKIARQGLGLAGQSSPKMKITPW